jgi:hypothetical protein
MGRGGGLWGLLVRLGYGRCPAELAYYLVLG